MSIEENNHCAQNTDKLIWSRETQEDPFQSYASISITKEGAVCICVGGLCIVKSIEKWHDTDSLQAEIEAYRSVIRRVKELNENYRIHGDELKAEKEKIESKVVHTQEWYGARFKRLEAWARKDLPEELCHEFFNIVANGTKNWMEEPTFEQQYNMLKYERDNAVKDLEIAREIFKEEIINKDKCKYNCRDGWVENTEQFFMIGQEVDSRDQFEPCPIHNITLFKRIKSQLLTSEDVSL